MAAPAVSSVKANLPSFSSSQGEKEPVEKPKKKDLFDHIAHRSQQAEGAWDFFRIAANVSQYPKLFSSLKEPYKTNIRTFSTAADLTGAALSFPALFKNVNDFRHHYRDLKAARALPESDPTKKKKEREALSNAALDVNNTLNSGSQGSLFLNDSKLVTLGRGYPIASGIYNATSLIGDGIEGIQEASHLKAHLNAAKTAKSTEEKERILQKIRLSSCVITKDIASVALSIIGLLALAFAALFQGFVFLPVLVLGLSSIWLIAKIGSYFYEQIIKDQPPLQQRLIKV